MIHQAQVNEVTTVCELALLLWPDHERDELAEELTVLLTRRDAAIFLAEENGMAVGFAQCQLRRDYVEGTETSPVGYLEGVFVREEYRHRGCARALLAACENWAKAQGCTEFASDCELDNEASLRFHLKVGFTEANRIICFAKTL